MKRNDLEIERKFLIRMPDRALLDRIGECSEIEQTYLSPDAEGVRARIRRRSRNGESVYTLTTKSHLTDMTRIEIEREIGRAEYEKLLQQADPERRTIRKTRCCIPYEGQLFEIDLFPFWKKQAYLEIELEREDQPVRFPPYIELLREVTSEERYTNSSLAKEIPEEEL